MKRKSSSPTKQAAHYAATFLRQALVVSGSWIADQLGLTDSQYRLLLLTNAAERKPSKVSVDVNRRLVDNWGLHPGEFWRNRQPVPLIRYEPNRVWFAVWDSTKDAESVSPAFRSERMKWASQLAHRCALARQRALLLQELQMKVASEKSEHSIALDSELASFPGCPSPTHPSPGENLQDYDPDAVRLDTLLMTRNPNTPLQERAEYHRFVDQLQRASPPTPWKRQQITDLQHQLELNLIEAWCWDSPISP